MDGIRIQGEWNDTITIESNYGDNYAEAVGKSEPIYIEIKSGKNTISMGLSIQQAIAISKELKRAISILKEETNA